MKQLLITIAAVMLVGCGQSVDIHDAATWGDVKAVKEYLEAGGDVNAKQGDSVSGLSGFGWTPLHIVAQVNTFDDNISERYLAGRKILELLIANDADVNAKDNDGLTPLHHARHKQIFEILIAGGADVNAKQPNGKTALDEALSEIGKPEIAALLRKHGAKTGEELKAEGK